MTTLQPTIEGVQGFKASGVACGLKPEHKRDLAVILSDAPCAAAGVFTTNRVRAAPVLLSQQRIQSQAENIRAVLINTGSANACTGEQGLHNADLTASWLGEELSVDPQHILLMSTGVIGTQLNMDRIQHGIIDAAVSARSDGWDAAAEAILTTDTVPKMVSVTIQEGRSSYTVAGIAKGAGMIAPDMATMLAVIVTDAGVDPVTLQTALHAAAAISFNRIAVDGDTSTNDTVFALANGASGVHIGGGAALGTFQNALTSVCVDLARSIVRDGEGATRFITLEVVGAPNPQAARQVAMAVATSPLVKTAFYGGDANWGRIVAAAGRSGVPVEPGRMKLWALAGEDGALGGLELFTNGVPAAYDEHTAAAIFNKKSISIRLDLGLGEASTVVWTCDLSHSYVDINAHYRT